MPTAMDLPQLLQQSIGSPACSAVDFKHLQKLLYEIIARLDNVESQAGITHGSASSIAPQPPSDQKKNIPGLTKSTTYHHLQDKVNRLERELGDLHTLPSTSEMLEKVKQEKPLTELWQHMQISKKADNNSEGVAMAMNLIEELAKDVKGLKDENGRLKDQLSKLDIDNLNKQLQQIEKMKEELTKMAGFKDKLKDLDAYKRDLDSLVTRLEGMPAAEELVTWAGMEDALNGVKGEMAAYRTESRQRLEMENRSTAMTPQPPTAQPPTPQPAPVSSSARPMSGRHSEMGRSSRARSVLSDGPSNDMLDVMEHLGSVNKRHSDLKKRVDDLERDMANKANKEDVATNIPDDLVAKLQEMQDKLGELDDLRSKFDDMAVLISDIPDNHDQTPPKIGDKAKASSFFLLRENTAPSMTSKVSKTPRSKSAKPRASDSNNESFERLQAEREVDVNRKKKVKPGIEPKDRSIGQYQTSNERHDGRTEGHDDERYISANSQRIANNTKGTGLAGEERFDSRRKDTNEILRLDQMANPEFWNAALQPIERSEQPELSNVQERNRKFVGQQGRLVSDNLGYEPVVHAQKGRGQAKDIQQGPLLTALSGPTEVIASGKMPLDNRQDVQVSKTGYTNQQPSNHVKVKTELHASSSGNSPTTAPYGFVMPSLKPAVQTRSRAALEGQQAELSQDKTAFEGQRALKSQVRTSFGGKQAVQSQAKTVYEGQQAGLSQFRAAFDEKQGVQSQTKTAVDYQQGGQSRSGTALEGQQVEKFQRAVDEQQPVQFQSRKAFDEQQGVQSRTRTAVDEQQGVQSQSGTAFEGQPVEPFQTAVDGQQSMQFQSRTAFDEQQGVQSRTKTAVDEQHSVQSPTRITVNEQRGVQSPTRTATVGQLRGNNRKVNQLAGIVDASNLGESVIPRTVSVTTTTFDNTGVLENRSRIDETRKSRPPSPMRPDNTENLDGDELAEESDDEEILTEERSDPKAASPVKSRKAIKTLGKSKAERQRPSAIGSGSGIIRKGSSSIKQIGQTDSAVKQTTVSGVKIAKRSRLPSGEKFAPVKSRNKVKGFKIQKSSDDAGVKQKSAKPGNRHSPQHSSRDDEQPIDSYEEIDDGQPEYSDTEMEIENDILNETIVENESVMESLADHSASPPGALFSAKVPGTTSSTKVKAIGSSLTATQVKRRIVKPNKTDKQPSQVYSSNTSRSETSRSSGLSGRAKYVEGRSRRPPGHSNEDLSTSDYSHSDEWKTRSSSDHTKSSGLLPDHDFTNSYHTIDQHDKMLPTPSRFSQTIREIIQRDYMGEINKLKRQIQDMEDENFAIGSRPLIDPYQTSATGEDLLKLNNIIMRLGQANRELRYRVADVEDEITKFAVSKGSDYINEEAANNLKDSPADNDRRFQASLLGGQSDAESIKRAQKAVMDLQAELEKMRQLGDYLSAENEQRTKETGKLKASVEKLNKTKADKDYVDTELDLKADKRSVDSKVNRSHFDSTITDLQNMIDDLLSKLLAYEDAWKKAHSKLDEEVDGKIDRGELERLKAWVDRKLKEINKKLKGSQGMFDPFCEDAAGLKRQLLPFNCLSCDKPVTVSTASPQPAANQGDSFSANKSTRPYTTYELDQIRQHAKSLLNADYVMDYYSMPRQCGGSHTMTYPHKRTTKAGTKDVFADPGEIPPEILITVRDETDIVGADGHVYRGRAGEQLEAKLPPQLQDQSPSRPRTSPGKRTTSARAPAARPKTAHGQSSHSSPEPGRARPVSARERPGSTMDRPDISMERPGTAMGTEVSESVDVVAQPLNINIETIDNQIDQSNTQPPSQTAV